MLVEDFLNRRADTAPYVIGGLFLVGSLSLHTLVVSLMGNTHIVTLLWLPQTNVLGGQPDNVAFAVDDASTSTTSAYVYPAIQLLIGIELIVPVVWQD